MRKTVIDRNSQDIKNVLLGGYKIKRGKWKEYRDTNELYRIDNITKEE